MENQKYAGSVEKTTREEKSVLLDMEIENLDEVIFKLKRLQSRIEACPYETDESPALRSSPSLVEVLSSGSARIKEKRNFMLDLIDSIENMIF